MHFKTACELTQALRTREISAVDVMEHTLSRIEALDEGLNAVVVRDFERARAAARAADTALAAGAGGVLTGVPMTVKEAINVAGLPTTWGMPDGRDGAVARDAVVVQRLRQAGAIIVGKTNVPTGLADWQTFNPVYGVTRNPWNPKRSPGGSSGGAAAALAAGFVPLEIGSDLSGSLRIPAHCCGVYAHRPSHGLVPMRGFAPPGVPVLSVAAEPDLAVLGPMARSAADLSMALDVIAGPDDDRARAYRLGLPPPRHTALEDFRVLVLDRHPASPTSSEVRERLSQLSEQLSGFGCRVAFESPFLPSLEGLFETFVPLLMSFVGADMPEAAYRSVTDRVASLPAFETDRGTLSLRGLVLSHRDWLHLDRARTRHAHQWRELFAVWDIVLCPAMPTTALLHDHAPMDERTIRIDGRSHPYDSQSVWSSVAAVCGQPATSMPVGRSGDVLPIGVQAIGPFMEDRTPLAFAHLVEKVRGGFERPPSFDA